MGPGAGRRAAGAAVAGGQCPSSGAINAAIREPLPGEYGASVQAVIAIGRKSQAVRETVKLATAAIRATGGAI